ncbi:hypothetical protein [Marinitoga aeolica]|uniref:Uncharacterized protein n=1 Tax=Marinitoga aeolica TaxID=2809031 RepID=A0ABY8PMS4_9BACT|nr:hypothetical protein [Marinitoga aeolica]WGS63933.1 hypothetical protein JRV97_06015 [Marinitoga aeolica]
MSCLTILVQNRTKITKNDFKKKINSLETRRTLVNLSWRNEKIIIQFINLFPSKKEYLHKKIHATEIEKPKKMMDSEEFKEKYF